ncbi:hypothetical protein RB195_015367 [Necator americanus]|uniref:Uncharacterized protein n=1 Tax=Necator americanus TaxID=51031 RepID=A0ABR1E618_NECAM
MDKAVACVKAIVARRSTNDPIIGRTRSRSFGVARDSDVKMMDLMRENGLKILDTIESKTVQDERGVQIVIRQCSFERENSRGVIDRYSPIEAAK